MTSVFPPTTNQLSVPSFNTSIWSQGSNALSMMSGNQLYYSRNGGILNGSMTAKSVTSTGSVLGASITSSGPISGASITSSGPISAASITSSGAVTGASITSSGAISGASITSSGAVNSARDFMANSSFRIGPSAYLTMGAVPVTTKVGVYVVTSNGWLGPGSATITMDQLGQSVNNDNFGGEIKIFVNSKTGGSNNALNGIMVCTYLKFWGGISFQTMYTSKSSNFTLSATTNGNSGGNAIVVTTDPTCYVSWFFTGAF